jgi:hypothetical protein
MVQAGLGKSKTLFQNKQVKKGWGYGRSTCLASVKPQLQNPVPPNKRESELFWLTVLKVSVYEIFALGLLLWCYGKTAHFGQNTWWRKPFTM